jgi:hypothetical protein
MFCHHHHHLGTQRRVFDAKRFIDRKFKSLQTTKEIATLSYVSFSDNERLIGDAAKNQVAMNPHNT